MLNENIHTAVIEHGILTIQYIIDLNMRFIEFTYKLLESRLSALMPLLSIIWRI